MKAGVPTVRVYQRYKMKLCSAKHLNPAQAADLRLDISQIHLENFSSDLISAGPNVTGPISVSFEEKEVELAHELYSNHIPSFFFPLPFPNILYGLFFFRWTCETYPKGM